MRTPAPAALALACLLFLAPAPLCAQSAADADALFQQAASLYNKGSLDKVIPLLLQAAVIDEKLGASRLADLAYDRKYLGICYANTGQAEKAQAPLEQALSLFASLGERKEQVQVLDILGQLDFNGAVYDAAGARFQAAIDLARASGIAGQFPGVLTNLGRVRQVGGRYTEAIELYQAALDLHVKAGSAAAAAQDLANIASAWMLWRHWPEAEEAYSRALAAFEQRGDKANAANSRRSLGICYANAGEPGKAREQLEQALLLYAGLGAVREQVDVQSRLGLLDYYRAAYDEAERRFQAALNLARSSGRATQVPGLLNNLGLVRYARGRYAEAIELYQAAYDEHVNAGDTAAAAESLGNIASVYMSWAHWPEAEDAYGRALAAFEQLGDAASAENTRINLGLLHSAQGSYVQARAELEEAITRAAARGLRQSEAYALAGLGAVYYATGLYDLAENAYRRALDIDKALDIQLNVVSVSTSLGRLYQAWGRYDQALDLYRSSLEAAQRLGVPDQELAALHLIGSVHAAQGRYDIALEQYDKALAMAELSGNPASKLPVLDSLGSAHFQLRSFEKAESYYRAALDLAQRLGLKDMEGREMIHLGGVNQVSGNRQNALLLYNAAVQACHAAGSKADEATALNNLGTLFIDMRSWDRAEAPLLQAIAIKEQLRATALGRDRMDFLASQVSSYRWLVAERARRGDAAAAFDASELMKARWLSEQLGGGAENPGFAGIRAIQGSLGVGSLVLDYANIDAEMPVLLSASRDAVRARDLSLQGAELPGGAASRAVAAEQPASRGFAIVRTAPRPSGFSDIVAAYRSLLAIARPSTEERAERDRLAHRLYDLLLGPAEKELEGKEELLVVPEGSLCALPFETLRMPDGRYLVERFHVIYVPSLTVKGQLERRRGAAGPAAGTPGAPRPLLALGGALYGGAPSRAARSVSDQQLTSLRLDAQRLGEQHRGMRELYAALGLDAWEELPGTLAEVSSIGRLMPGGTVLTGAQASEQRIKQLSLSGELMRYGVIHFATHGMAVPEAPELSALVLSLKDGEGAEDGFLTAGEIADLKLAADFVNLSACETGLGRILSGEGIVGLSQAFLSAGSNGLSVSLWPVADDATRQFMTELYRLVGEKGLSFARAMTEVKRRFIREGAWQEPLYWAPFVYYGVDTGGQAKER